MDGMNGGCRGGQGGDPYMCESKKGTLRPRPQVPDPPRYPANEFGIHSYRGMEHWELISGEQRRQKAGRQKWRSSRWNRTRDGLYIVPLSSSTTRSAGLHTAAWEVCCQTSPYLQCISSLQRDASSLARRLQTRLDDAEVQYRLRRLDEEDARVARRDGFEKILIYDRIVTLDGGDAEQVSAKRVSHAG
jgi:hypothetical protein